MATPINKLVVRGSTKISLHDRFTRLQRVEPEPQPPPPQRAAPRPAPVQKTHFNRGVGYPSYSAPPSPPLYHPASRYQHPGNRDVDRYTTMQAALKLKRRSMVHNRLGMRRGTQPYYSAPPPASASHWRSGRGGYFNRYQSNRRASQYNSTMSLHSQGGGPRFPYRRRGGYFSPRGGVGRFRGAGRRGYRGRGYGGRGRGRGGYGRVPPPKKEDLDAQLDQYMSKTRGTLDHELDEYMKQKDSDE